MNQGDEERLVMVMHAKDNVGVCLRPIASDRAVQAGGESIRVLSDIPLGHKIALRDLSPGDEVVKYGEVIGRAQARIERGEHVHDHNISDY